MTVSWKPQDAPSEPRGGLFQDETWDFRELFGCPVEKFLGLVDENDRPLVFFLKPSGAHWQRFYLDAGLGFWGEYDEREITDELEGEAVMDWADRFGISGELMGAVTCEPGPRLRIEIGSGEIVLETTDASDIEAPIKTPYFRPLRSREVVTLPEMHHSTGVRLKPAKKRSP